MLLAATHGPVAWPRARLHDRITFTHVRSTSVPDERAHHPSTRVIKRALGLPESPGAEYGRLRLRVVGRKRRMLAQVREQRAAGGSALGSPAVLRELRVCS